MLMSQMAALLIGRRERGVVSWPGVGAQAFNAASPAPNYPSGIQAGELLVIHLGTKYGNPAAPSGWTLQATAQATSGARSSAYTKIADGSETGSLTLTNFATNVGVARIHRFAKTAGDWDLMAVAGADNSSGTGFSASGSGFNAEPGDMVCVFSAFTAFVGSLTSESLFQTGQTFGTITEQYIGGTILNDDMVIRGASCGVSASVTGQITHSGTLDVASTGADVFLRIRAA